jgi:citrate lyase beta subunit
MHPRRALLYMPGDDMHKIRKAATLGVDCICMDIEDGVALNRKVAARANIVTALQGLDFGRSERLVRINAVSTGLAGDDLQLVLPAWPDGIVIPKVDDPDQVQWVSQQIAEMERSHRRPFGSTRLMVIIETARAILNLPRILASDNRIQAVIFGADDLAVDIGATRTPEGWEVFYARSAVVIHAAAFDLQAIDLVNGDFHDLESLRREALQGARMGFAGKQVIHPNQVAVVQEAFTPTPEAVARAERVLAAYARYQAEGVGAFVMDGKMVDAPIVKAAQRVLDQAGAAKRS